MFGRGGHEQLSIVFSWNDLQFADILVVARFMEILSTSFLYAPVYLDKMNIDMYIFSSCLPCW